MYFCVSSRYQIGVVLHQSHTPHTGNKECMSLFESTKESISTMASFNKQPISVPTKTYDGGSSSRDGSLRVRMTDIEDLSAGRPNESASKSNEVAATNAPEHRRSRYSCEEHPSRILMEMFIGR